jgi:DnaJ-class molecular chaperone
MTVELYEGLKIKKNNTEFSVSIGDIGIRILGADSIKARSIKAIKRRIDRYLVMLEADKVYQAEKIRYANAPKKDCFRCQGKGYIDQYLHVAHGVCFKCGGSGKVERK